MMRPEQNMEETHTSGVFDKGTARPLSSKETYVQGAKELAMRVRDEYGGDVEHLNDTEYEVVAREVAKAGTPVEGATLEERKAAEAAKLDQIIEALREDIARMVKPE